MNDVGFGWDLLLLPAVRVAGTVRAFMVCEDNIGDLPSAMNRSQDFGSEDRMSLNADALFVGQLFRFEQRERRYTDFRAANLVRAEQRVFLLLRSISEIE